MARRGDDVVAASRNVSTAAEQFRRGHDEGYLYINQGLTCDEGGQARQAETLYAKGLACIEQALRVYDCMPRSNALTVMADKV